MSGYRHRRLRKPQLPRAILTSRHSITAEQAAQFRLIWLAACRRRDVLIVDGTQFTVTELR